MNGWKSRVASVTLYHSRREPRFYNTEPGDIWSLEDGCYTLGWMSPEQEQEVCHALVNLGEIETEQGLHSEGVLAIQGTLNVRWMTHEPRCMIYVRAGRSRKPRHRATSAAIMAPCPSRSSAGSNPERLDKTYPSWVASASNANNLGSGILQVRTNSHNHSRESLKLASSVRFTPSQRGSLTKCKGHRWTYNPCRAR